MYIFIFSRNKRKVDKKHEKFQCWVVKNLNAKKENPGENHLPLLRYVVISAVVNPRLPYHISKIIKCIPRGEAFALRDTLVPLSYTTTPPVWNGSENSKLEDYGNGWDGKSGFTWQWGWKDGANNKTVHRIVYSTKLVQVNATSCARACLYGLFSLP